MTYRLFILSLVAALAVWRVAVAGPTAWETQQDYQAYESEQPMLASSNAPQERVIAAIAARLDPIVARQYGVPIHYYLTKETDPNAYSYYGPRVYISVGMVNFAQNREEIAGVLCHESTHVLHHDGTRSFQSGQHNAHVIDMLQHHHAMFARLAGLGSEVVRVRFTQGQEYGADKGGATLCASAGLNPWGLVWMLRRFQSQPDFRTSRWSYLSDHPSNQARIKALTRYLKTNSQFATWPSDPQFGTRI